MGSNATVTGPRPAWRQYAVAALLVLVGLLVRLVIGELLAGFPFLTFFPAVLLAAYFGGSGPGILATFTSALLVDYYLIDPPYTLIPSSTSNWIGLGFFFLVCAAMIGLIVANRRAMAELTYKTGQLRELNEQLERRIADRTRELAAANSQLRTEIQTREATEAQIRQAQKMEAVGQLTGGVAHDFNNMLQVIIGNLNIVKNRLPKSESHILRFIDHALGGTAKAASLTQRLLAFSRQTPLNPVVMDLNALVQGMAELLRRTLGERISLECVLAGGLWRTRIDPGQLESAILNLAVNARDAMPNGGKLTIETLNAHLDDSYAAAYAEVVPGQYAVVAVTDSGMGMPPESVARAFDPFFTTKQVGQGTGLGLSQVYGFIKQSGGHVTIYSEIGRGTTVKMYLPRDDAKSAQDAERTAAEAAFPQGRHDEVILVVEDEEAVRLTTAESLSELGYTVRAAASGEEALRILETDPAVELLFTDVVMPGMTGRELADNALRARPGLRVLYATGYTRNAIVHNGVIDPGREMLMKPFTLDQLARKVRDMLDAEHVV